MILHSLILLAATSAAPATNSPEEVVRSLFAAFNAHDIDAIVSLYAPNAVLNSPDFCRPRGRDEVARTYAELFDAFPDISDEVQHLVSGGNDVGVMFVSRSSKGAVPLELPIVGILTVENGKIVEDRVVFDVTKGGCAP